MNYEVLGSILHLGVREEEREGAREGVIEREWGVGGRRRGGGKVGEGEGERIAFVRACVHVLMCTSVTIHVEARGQPWE